MTPEQKVKLNQLIQSVESWCKAFYQAPDNTLSEWDALEELMAARKRLREYVESLTCSH